MFCGCGLGGVIKCWREVIRICVRFFMVWDEDMERCGVHGMLIWGENNKKW